MKKRLILCLSLLLLATLIIWTIWGNVTIGVTHYTVASSRLPDSFHNYKIAVVSDVHNAEFGENNSQLIKLVQNEAPDMIAITGDLIDSNRTNLEIAVALVQQLVKIAPCYYVTGNHEAWIGSQYEELENRLIGEGVTVFHNNAVSLTKSNETIQLAGLDDPDFTDSNSYISESILSTRLHSMQLSENYCILLSHRPETFEAYVSENIDLVLSGHAHGGQLRLPFLGGVIAPDQGLFPTFDAGEYTKNTTTMIVSRGIGNSIIPVRFNNRPEIVVVELKCDSSLAQMPCVTVRAEG